MEKRCLVVFAAFWLAASPAAALTITYTLSMDGAQEVPAPGDPDGTATGTLTIDDSTGGVGTISWSFTYANIDTPLAAMHIHGPAAPAGVAAGVFVGLGVATSGGPGTLIASVVTTMANAAAINASPTNFYVNIHNTPFPGGALRGQLGVVPEPGTLSLLALGFAGLVWTGRRRA
jgi:hypothetical protein